MERLSPQLLLDYLVDLGSALMSVGCPTHRLEELLVTVAKLEGHRADVFAVPTGLFIGVRTPEGETSLTTMVRVADWTNDLERLTELDEVLNQVVSRTLTIPDARRRIREVLARPPAWKKPMQLLASAASSAGAAVSFGGSLSDAVLAGLGGLLLRGLMFALPQDAGVRVLENFVGGFVAAMIAWVSTLIWPGNGREVLVLSIIIPLLPGLTLTTGLSELTYRNLVAGTARMMHAMVTLLSLVFGIAVVVAIENAMALHSPPAIARDVAAWWVQALGIGFASFGFGVLLGLPPRRLPISFAAGILVSLLTAATHPLPGAQSAFICAFVLAVVANLAARITQRPALLYLLPGMLLLVPGALSFRSLETLLSGDTNARGGDDVARMILGISGLVDVVLIAGALVMGLLVANVTLPARKLL